MRALFQRVSRASVRIGGETVGQIGPGALVLVGVRRGDTPADAAKLAAKTARLRVFDDPDGKLNLPVSADPARAILAVSQFTLCADTRHGNRPSFIEAAPPEEAEPLFLAYVEALRALGIRVETGRFRTFMEVELVNDGPVTILLES